jgi:hypothetical protein
VRSVLCLCRPRSAASSVARGAREVRGEGGGEVSERWYVSGPQSEPIAGDDTDECSEVSIKDGDTLRARSCGEAMELRDPRVEDECASVSNSSGMSVMKECLSSYMKTVDSEICEDKGGRRKERRRRK